MSVATNPVRQARDAYVSFLRSQKEFLADLDPNRDEHFVAAVTILLRTGCAQRDLAAAVGVDPATISRWANGSRLPIKAIYRKAYIEAMRIAMDQLIKKAA